ncbi:MAG: chemotaxis protein CheB, partial [Anaerolineae bacterium]
MCPTSGLVHAPIRVLIIDHSSAWRRVLAGILAQRGEIHVLDSAPPENALPLIYQHRPDVLIWAVDPSNPQTIRSLRSVQFLHIPIIALTPFSEPNLGDTLSQYDVQDIYVKPKNFLTADLNVLRMELIAKIRAVIDPRAKAAGPDPAVPSVRPATRPLSILSRLKPPTTHLRHPSDPIVVAIAASTGGPQSLDQVIMALPADLPACVIILQHMPAGFTASFAERLNRKGPLPVKEAAEGDRVLPGRAYVAAGGFHLTVKRSIPGGPLFLHLDESPPVNGLRPAANVLFHSLVKEEVERVVAVVMTGMGTDGAEGIQAIKAGGGWIIAQDEETSVIYGMPKA